MKKTLILTFICCILLVNKKSVADCGNLNPHLGYCQVSSGGNWPVSDYSTFYMTPGTQLQVYTHFIVYGFLGSGAGAEADCGSQMWFDGITSGESYNGTSFSAQDNAYGSISFYVSATNAWAQIFATW